MFICKNIDPTGDRLIYYNGVEKSPLGFGFSATGEPPGTTMIGKDGNLWQVVQKSGVKIWGPADQYHIDNHNNDIPSDILHEKAESVFYNDSNEDDAILKNVHNITGTEGKLKQTAYDTESDDEVVITQKPKATKKKTSAPKKNAVLLEPSDDETPVKKTSVKKALVEPETPPKKTSVKKALVEPETSEPKKKSKPKKAGKNDPDDGYGYAEISPDLKTFSARLRFRVRKELEEEGIPGTEITRATKDKLKELWEDYKIKNGI